MVLQNRMGCYNMDMESNNIEGVRKKAYIYARVSTKEQVDGASLDVQEKACREFADRQLNADIVRVYREEGESAKTANRTQLTKMLNDARKEKGDVDYVVAYHPDRISRNAEIFWGVIKATLRKCGVELRYACQPGIDGSRIGDFAEGLCALVAQLENGSKADRVHDSMAERAKQGYWVTQPPLGFKVKVVMPDGGLADSLGRKERVKYPKVLVPDDTILSGENLSVADKVAKVLVAFADTDISETDAHEMAMKIGLKAKNGKSLHFNSLHHMLEHPVYAGYSQPGKLLSESIKLRFPGLITKEQYDRIQVKLRTGKRELIPRETCMYPLDGTLLCEHCGMPLHGDAPRDGSGERKNRYYCRGGVKRGHNYESCKAAEIHELFDSFLQQIAPEEGTKRLFKEVLKRTAMRKLSSANAELKELKDAEAALDAKKRRALDLLLDGKLSSEEKDQVMHGIDELRFSLGVKRKELEEQQQLNEITIEYVCNFMDKPAKLWKDADLASKRALQKLMFPNGLHIDLKVKKCRTEDLSPLYSVINVKKEPEGCNSDDMVISAGVEPALTG